MKQPALKGGLLALLAAGRSLPPTPGDIWKMFLGRFQKLMVAGKEVEPGSRLAYML